MQEFRGSGHSDAIKTARIATFARITPRVADPRMLDGAGLPGRPWFRHLIYARLPSYRAETLPAIREAIWAGSPDFARLQRHGLGMKLDALGRIRVVPLQAEVAREEQARV